MKKLVIPEKQEDVVLISEITKDSKHLIIAYKNNKPIGIYRCEHNYEVDFVWFLTDCSDNECEEVVNHMASGDTLQEAILKGLENKVFDELKVIEFV